MNVNMENRVIIIAGPTGVGKTKLSIEIAKKIDAEIVSMDSMQIYKKMDIGTAKITKSEMQGIPHHMIDIVDPDNEFDIVIFQKMAREAIDSIHRKNKVAILVGGTGFYIQAVVRSVNFQNQKLDKTYKKTLELISSIKNGKEILYDLLKEIDYAAYKTIHKNNVKRVIRALEFYNEFGYSIQEHNIEEAKKGYLYETSFYVLTDKREEIYKRIDNRVDQMMADGLEKEVTYLLNNYELSKTAIQAIGYKEMISFLSGELSRDECIEKIKINSRHYAKRQLTWFNREKDAKFIDISKFSSIEDVANNLIENWR